MTNNQRFMKGIEKYGAKDKVSERVRTRPGYLTKYREKHEANLRAAAVRVKARKEAERKRKAAEEKAA